MMTLENGVSGATGSGSFEIIEAQMTASPGRDIEPIRTYGFFRLVVEGDFDMCGIIPGVQNADGFVAGHLRRGAMAIRRDVTFCDCPLFSSDVHSC